MMVLIYCVRTLTKGVCSVFHKSFFTGRTDCTSAVAAAAAAAMVGRFEPPVVAAAAGGCRGGRRVWWCHCFSNLCVLRGGGLAAAER